MELLFEGFLDNLEKRVPEHAFLIESIRAAFEATSLDQIDQPGLVSIITKDITAIKNAVTSIWENTNPELGIYPEYLNARQSLFAFKYAVLNQIDTTLSLLNDNGVSLQSKVNHIKSFEVFFKDCMASLMGDLDTDNKVGISEDVLNFALTNPETGLLSMQKDYQKLINDVEALKKSRTKRPSTATVSKNNAPAAEPAPSAEEVPAETEPTPSLLDAMRKYDPETAQMYDDACKLIDNGIGGAVFLVPNNQRDAYGVFIDNIATAVKDELGIDITDTNKFIFERVNPTTNPYGDIYRFTTLDDDISDAAFLSSEMSKIAAIIKKVGVEEFGDEYLIYAPTTTKATIAATRSISNGTDQQSLSFTMLERAVYAKERNVAQIKQKADMADARDSEVESQIKAMAKKVADYANSCSPDVLQTCTKEILVDKIGATGYKNLASVVAEALAPYIAEYAHKVYSKRSGVKMKDNFEWTSPKTEKTTTATPDDIDSFEW